LDTAQFILGPAVAAFEKDFATFCGTSDAIGVNSGTSALHLALLAAGVGRDDEVITVPFTFVATVAAIEYTGARPVFVDSEPVTWNLDPQEVARRITPRTKAIIPVHLYGQPADMDPILDVARKHGLVVIEDACQAHGSEYRGGGCGSMGELGCFSFYPGKNLGAYGEGGAVVTSDAAMAAKIRLLRAWGEETRYEHKYRAFNYRMDGIQGAVLGVKLRYLDAWTEARRRHAAEYARRLEGSSARAPLERAWAHHVYHVYVVRLSDRDASRARLAEAGVQTGVLSDPRPPSAGVRTSAMAVETSPVSERAAAEVLSLPMFPEMTAEQIDTVAGLLCGVRS
jgi:dTDP-4-amino-4,6-dideoxygalactose transaminase